MTREISKQEVGGERDITRAYLSVEVNVLEQSKVLGVGVQVIQDQASRREGRVPVGDRIVTVLRRGLARDDVHAVVDALVPVASDLRVLLETIERHALALQFGGDRETRETGSDETELLFGREVWIETRLFDIR